ncbi:MAG: A/G-specific adenine glycosylase [Halioglobus sp.]
MTQESNFANRILAWYDVHGRKDLPWQQAISPYRVWVSEIMLQQTQVSTVIPYFERFMQRFPDVRELAAATQDDVLHHWTGLGYYARARNLHKTAQIVSSQLDSKFPDSIEGLCELPGIGRSTAGAVLSIASGQRAAILDGNVKRVLARHAAVEGWPGVSRIHAALWDIAEQRTPDIRHADYTQAMMDLGATLCTRSKPRCGDCPVAIDCIANHSQTQTLYPGKKPKKVLPIKATRFLLVMPGTNEVLLEKRPDQGIWGGLWCFPEMDVDTQSIETWCLDRLQTTPTSLQQMTPFRHTFSHYHLDISPVLVSIERASESIMETDARLWYNLRQPQNLGLAAPVVKLLKSIQQNSN